MLWKVYFTFAPLIRKLQHSNVLLRFLCVHQYFTHLYWIGWSITHAAVLLQYVCITDTVTPEVKSGTLLVATSLMKILPQNTSRQKQATNLWPCRSCRGWSPPRPGQCKDEPPRNVSLELRCTTSFWCLLSHHDCWDWQREKKIPVKVERF